MFNFTVNYKICIDYSINHLFSSISVHHNILSLMSQGNFVKKRNGNSQEIDISKIKSFIKHAVNIEPVCNKVEMNRIINLLQTSIGSKMQTSDIPTFIAEQCASLNIYHWHYGLLAGKCLVTNIHKETENTFSEAMNRADIFLSNDFLTFVNQNRHQIDNFIKHERDFQYDMFAIRTLQRSYLMKMNNVIIERPQYLIMRVAVALGLRDQTPSLDYIHKTYDAMSRQLFTHATPTLFHAGFKKQQLASCYLMTMKSDSISGIFDTLKQCALISKGAGGIGLSISQIRGSGSMIKGTGGTSNGIIPMLRVFNDTSRYVDQGGGKRKGSFAIWLEPHHPDILSFLDLKKNHGVEEERCRDLFLGLWISDLFMKKTMANEDWYLFSSTEAPLLQDAYGEEYEKLYYQYVKEKKYLHKMKAQELWYAILASQTETGTPYLMYKDAVNSKSNQKHLGTIRGSNLCTEICEYTSEKEIAVCTLASINLTKCISQKTFSYKMLMDITKMIVQNLNRVIDINWYPLPEAEYSNKRNRPIGIGVQGMSDLFQILNIAYDSEEARQLNKNIFETIYYSAVSESIEEAKKFGVYETYHGSPSSKGILQFDMWNVTPSTRHNWSQLKLDLTTYGMRNSLLLAPMPTASTAQILSNTESFEPRTSNLYTRRVLAGEYVVVNKHLQNHLIKMNLWNDQTVKDLVADRGSIQKIDYIPEKVKNIYKTVWEISQRVIIDMAADRGAYIDQSQSLNLYIQNPSDNVLTSMHFYAWKKGLKTGQYYLRSQPNARPIQFTVEANKVKKARTMECDEEICLMCSS